MKLLADLHTHSNNSRFRHGKNSIEEMAIEANEKGLVEIGITDHGYAHFFRTSKEKLKKARAIVNDINEWSKTKVLLGIEADIISEDGTLDIDNETLSMIDILIVSYHRMTDTNFASYFGFTKKTEEAKRKCTNAFINAIRKYPVSIVAHLDSILTTDLYEIGKVCNERGTLVEINNRHVKWNDKQMEDLIASGCMFVVSSDAHSREKVGNVDRALEFIRKYDIPSERVANVEFTEEEKSEEDRNFSVYQSIYEQIAKSRIEKESVLDNRRKTEFTGNLSSEMENELRKIAGEKGLKYESRGADVVEGEYMKTMSGDDMDLIKQAEEYIQKQSLNEIQKENEELNLEFEESSETFSFDDDHPLVRDSFEERFQPFNKKLIDEVDSKQEDSKSVSDSKLKPKGANTTSNANSASGSAYEQLSSSSSKVQEFKNIMSGGNSVENNISPQESKPTQTRQVFKKVEPENFMQSITQTNLVNNSKAIDVTQKEQKPAEKKKAPQRGGRRGAFIAVDNLIGDNKK